MAHKKLETMSVYYLMRELLYDGKAGLEESIEPIEINDLIEQLIEKCNINFGDEKKKWVDWFVNTYAEATDIEKNSISVTYKIIDAENKYLPRIEPD